LVYITQDFTDLELINMPIRRVERINVVVRKTKQSSFSLDAMEDAMHFSPRKGTMERIQARLRLAGPFFFPFPDK